MSTIDQKGPSGKPANDTSGEDGRTERSAEETARIREELEASGAHAEVDAAMDRVGEIIDKPAAESTEERARRALTALADLRAALGEDSEAPEVASALSQIEGAILNPREEGDDDEPTTSRTLPPALSRFALRDDGVLLVSLEDGGDRDTAGREVIAFMVLSGAEAASARAAIDGSLSDAAAHVIGRLPMRST